jgi:hypothetical protein
VHVECIRDYCTTPDTEQILCVPRITPSAVSKVAGYAGNKANHGERVGKRPKCKNLSLLIPSARVDSDCDNKSRAARAAVISLDSFVR